MAPDTPARPPRIVRTPFACGDYLTRYPANAPFALRIDSPMEKPGWSARSESGYGHPPHPGTPVLFEDQYYEVVEIRWKEGSFPRYFYYLRAWEERFPLRAPVEYTTGACRELLEERKRRLRRRNAGWMTTLTLPFVGLLPAADQTRLEQSTGVPAVRMSLVSALVTLAASVPYVVSLLASFAGGGFALPGGEPVLRIAIYLFVESTIRLGSSLMLSAPIGSLLVFFPIELWRAIRRELDPGFRQQRLERMQVGRRGASLLTEARDEVLEVYGQEHDLEVVSLLPKPHWSPTVGVHYNDVWYLPLDSRRLQEGKSIRYRFLLTRAPEHVVFRQTVDYHPEEVRQLFQEKRRRDLGTWVDTLAPFWGLLPGADQKQLELVYGFDRERFCRWTIVALGVFGVFQVIAAALNLTHHLGGEHEGLWLLVGVVALVESILRWRWLRAGRPSGSLLGFVLRPFASRFFD